MSDEEKRSVAYRLGQAAGALVVLTALAVFLTLAVVATIYVIGWLGGQ